MHKKIKIKATKANSGSGVFIGYIFIILGFVFGLLTSNLLAFILFCAIGFYYAFSSYGFEVKKNRTEYREYFSYMGIKLGKWKPISEMPFITVFKIGQAETQTAGRGMQETTNIELVFKVYLLSPTHKTRVLVKVTKDEKEAQEITEYLISELNIKYDKFQPKQTATR